MSEEKYNRRGITYWLLRKNADDIIIPYLKQISNKKVLEVGIGYGYYKDYYFQRNHVVGYDVNPQLGEKLGIKVIVGKADEIRDKVNEKFQYVMSFFMTEYLEKEALRTFINDGCKVVEEGGIFLTTIIINRGWGLLYTMLANMKGIKKYSYSLKEIKRICSGKDYRIIPLPSYFGIPVAVMIEIRV